jgi:hypothetical protein
MARHPSRRIRVLSRGEGRRLLDRQARRHLGVSGEEFVRRWETGQFDSRRDRPEVMRVASLLPFAR